jgi:hypothetical protein
VFSRGLSLLKNSTSSSGWGPHEPTPSGFTETTVTHSFTVNSLSNLSFKSSGHYSRGTIELEGSGAEVGDSPPEYDEVRRGEKEVGECTVVVVAR